MGGVVTRGWSAEEILDDELKRFEQDYYSSKRATRDRILERLEQAGYAVKDRPRATKPL